MHKGEDVGPLQYSTAQNSTVQCSPAQRRMSTEVMMNVDKKGLSNQLILINSEQVLGQMK